MSIRHVFDTAGPWAGARLGLWAGVGCSSLIWAGWFHDPTLRLVAATVPVSDAEIVTGITVVIGLLAAFGLGVVAGHARMVRQRRTIRRLGRSVESLTGQLSEAEDVLRRATGGTDDILTAVRGTHHRQEG